MSVSMCATTLIVLLVATLARCTHALVTLSGEHVAMVEFNDGVYDDPTKVCSEDKWDSVRYAMEHPESEQYTVSNRHHDDRHHRHLRVET